MNYQNNIQVLKKAAFSRNLICVGPKNQLAKVHLVGKLIRWVKSLITKRAFDDCQITRIAEVLKNMIESNQLSESDKAVVQQKFNEILDKKSLKACNKKVIQDVYQALFSKPKSIPKDESKKARITALAEKVVTEGFAAIQTSLHSDLLAVIEHLANESKLNGVLSLPCAKNSTQIEVVPLLHTAITSLAKDKAFLAVRQMIEKGSDPHSYSIRISPITCFQTHALILAEERENYPLKNYLVDILNLSYTTQAQLVQRAEGTYVNAQVVFKNLIDNLEALPESEIFKKIELLSHEKLLNKVKTCIYKDGTEEQYTLLVSAYYDLSVFAERS